MTASSTFDDRPSDRLTGPLRQPGGARLPRRRCLRALGTAAAAALVAGSAPVAGAAQAQPPGLAALARSKGFRYGAAPFSYPPIFTPSYDTLIDAECSLLAPVLNWDLISPVPGQFRIDSDLGEVAFARRNGLALTGFHLLWHEAVPTWFARLPGAADARRAIEAHIARMGAAYAGATWSVNVVNEAIDPNSGRADGLHNDAFAAQLGGAYLDLAFRAARRAFPHALLLYNDYGTEQDDGGMARKRAALLGWIDRLRARGTPIDGVGLQSHLTLSRPFDERSYAGFLRELAGRGVSIAVTELDVLDLSAPAAIEVRDRAVADLYRRYLSTVLDNEAVVSVVTWGLSDRYTWLTRSTGPQFVRADGLPTRPLPFDAQFRPKPAYAAMVETFRAARPRGGFKSAVE